MTDEIRVGQRGADILEIVLARPEQGNALSPAMAEAITRAIDAMPATTRAICIRAEGPDFCTGRKPVLPPPGSRATALDLRQLIADPVLEFYQRLRDAPVPVIAAVQGRAAGVGCAVAGLADVCIASEAAVFSVPEMDKDIAPTLVMTALADRLPRAALARLVLSRDPIGAAEAKAIGLIGMTCPDVDLAKTTDELLAKLATNSVPVVRGVKTFLNLHPEMSFAARREAAALINGMVTAERYR
jgi:enoyl-CoA hydratase/carnithine racemase